MFTFIDITNALAFRHRVASAIEALKGLGVSADDVRAEFLAAGENKMAGQDAWERLDRLENPTAAELRLFARVLRVNTTWLITGDVRFVPELMATTCLCWEVPEHLWTTYGSAVDPATTHEYNPDCPVDGEKVAANRDHFAAAMGLLLNRELPESTIEPALIAAANPTDTEF
jgi:hypothetical protein